MSSANNRNNNVTTAAHTEAEDYFKKSYLFLIKQLVARKIDCYDAEDIVQEAFLRSMVYFDSFDNKYCTYGQWFSGILNRCQKDFHRAEKVQGMSVEIKDNHLMTNEDFGVNNKTVKEIEAEIGRMAEKSRYICYLYFIRGHTPREISRIVDSKATVVSDIVLQFKKRMLKKYGG